MIAGTANASTTFSSQSYTGATLLSDANVQISAPNTLTGKRLDLTVNTSGTPVLSLGVLDAGK